ncbi:MAG: hypothetical protein KBF57_03025 [Saprospiraceae bacterium]|nr:hypothetical protein [Saprospiraceae bacterium]
MEDISAIELLIVQLAKHHYKTENPERVRVPRGFTEGISLQLESLEPGSTILPISMILAANYLFPPENIKYFQEAGNTIIEAIKAAEENQPINFPQQFLPYFNKIGRKLQDDEALEFTPNETKKSRLTKSSRKKLLSQYSTKYTDEILIRGTIGEMNKVKRTFQIQAVTGQTITGNINPEYGIDLEDAFESYDEGTLVKLKGIGVFNENGRIELIDLVDNVEFLDQKDVPSRLEKLAQLKQGWLNADSPALDSSGLKKFEHLFEMFYPIDIDLPYIFPTPDGNIIAEWNNETFSISLEINLQNFTGRFQSVNLINHNTIDQTIVMDTLDGWTQLNTELKNSLVRVYES